MAVEDAAALSHAISTSLNVKGGDGAGEEVSTVTVDWLSVLQRYHRSRSQKSLYTYLFL